MAHQISQICLFFIHVHMHPGKCGANEIQDSEVLRFTFTLPHMLDSNFKHTLNYYRLFDKVQRIILLKQLGRPFVLFFEKAIKG